MRAPLGSRLEFIGDNCPGRTFGICAIEAQNLLNLTHARIVADYARGKHILRHAPLKLSFFWAILSDHSLPERF